MTLPLDFAVRERLTAYLAREISLHEFEDWFFPETWGVDLLDNLSLISLVYGIKLRLAEFSHGDWTEDELRSFLHPFMEKYEVIVSSTPAKFQMQYGTSSMNSHIHPIVIYSARSVDIKSLKGYV